MLHIQRFIASHGIEALKSDLGINVYEHPHLPLIGCKYSQIDSPRTHPVVREARGIVLEQGTWKVVAKPFDRFFNVGEFVEEFAQFNWNDFTCVEKADGSLAIVYYYNGTWHMNTSGSFGLGQAPNYDGTWRDLFWRFAKFDKATLFTHCTYIFELCTPWNKIVKTYKQPTVFLLGVSDPDMGNELCEIDVDQIANRLGVKRPTTYTVTSRDQIAELIITLEDQSEIHEGVVIRDSNNLRYKWKTEKYRARHHLKDNGNVILPKRLTAIALTGKSSEILADLPEIRSALAEVELTLDIAHQELISLWESNKNAETQKSFALAVKFHEFAWILFQLRKSAIKPDNRMHEVNSVHIEHSQGAIWRLFRDNNDKIASALFGKQTFTFDVVEIDEEETG